MSEQNLLIAVSLGLTADKVAGWASTIRATGYNGDIVLIEAGPESIDRAFCDTYGIELVRESIGPQNFDVCRTFRANRYVSLKRKFSIYNDRFGLMWEYLSRSGKTYDYVITTDITDVIFQRNPFDWLRERGETGLVLGPEWVTLKEGWLARNFQDSFGTLIADRYKEETACCAGVIAGTGEAVMDLCLLVYLMTALKPQYYASGGAADQAAMNLIARNSLTRGNVTFCKPEDNLVLHAAVFEPGTPYMNENKVSARPPVFRDGTVFNAATDQPYCIVHQYNRMGDWAGLAFRNQPEPAGLDAA